MHFGEMANLHRSRKRFETLKAQVKRLQMEKDILKKATGPSLQQKHGEIRVYRPA